MDWAFSRRSFLKYTAVAAVAVASTAMLTGCEHGYNPVKYEVGTTNTVLKTQSTLDSVNYNRDKQQLEFQLTIYNGRKNEIKLNSKSFVVKSNSYCALENQNLGLEFKQGESTDDIEYVYGSLVKNGQTTSLTVVAKNFPEEELNEVLLTFFPHPEKYNEYSSNWLLNINGSAE